ncbi:MAG: hypothetical protein E6Q48_02200 [Limnohabitans sp.]|nr:MAG: hypothetical protein E6Q48_02200 [Limnohabitans sp.]
MRKWLWVAVLVLWQGWAWGTSLPQSGPGVVVVLAGGGAKGFAHLALLRRLERDGVRISRLVGTSMGAVIGGLYASGLSTADIERVMGGLDPAKVALDQIDRLELPLRAREYQRQYPIDLEFGIRDGQLSFARGVSDGQRFLALLQQLTAHLPPHVDFDQLRIPFRAVATRYRDGELTVFREGPLHLAIRASMAAPGVFAPVEVNGETYVDGGLVANLPIEVALQEGASVVVASYLGQQEEGHEPAAGNALAVANRMLDILIRQNERRNLALLREQDLLVQPQLKEVGFTDFRRAPEIVAMGEQAIRQQEERFIRLASQWSTGLNSDRVAPAFNGREIVIEQVRVTGTTHTQEGFVSAEFRALQGQTFSTSAVARVIDRLYTSGHFERVSYSLEQIKDGRYALVVDVQEKPYGPHYFKTSLGFSAERGGINQFAVGMGYRRPWLNASGLELAVDAQAGTQTELGVKLYQPLKPGLGLQAHVRYQSTLWPVYPPADLPARGQDKLAYALLSNRSAGVDLAQDWGRGAVLRVGWVARQLDYQLDTASTVGVPLQDGSQYSLTLDPQRVRYAGWRLQWLVDKLDSVSFPEHGHYLNAVAEHALTGTEVRSHVLNARWAYPYRTHVLNLGLNLGHIQAQSGCVGCRSASALYLGGFQNMGAYRMGQLVGDRLVHAYMTYMYRWSDGGLLRQKTFLGAVAEAGDVWFAGQAHAVRYSGTLFVAVDSKIGDIYMGLARGTGGMTNAFVQLGRRFGW